MADFGQHAFQAVVITGCDSGLGYSLARYCHRLGMVVVAGCHQENSEGGEELMAMEEGEEMMSARRMFVVKGLDVRSEKSVENLRRKVEKIVAKTRSELWAVVNNAATLVLAEAEWQTEAMMTNQVEVK